MEYLDNSVPIYIGQVSLDLINATKIFLDKPISTQNFKLIEARKSFMIADTFKVTPFLVDHSSPEAFAFLVEVDGKRIFYSGDFRATGNKKVLYEKLIKKPPKDIDLLFIEGTMVERDNLAYPTENDVAKALHDIIKRQKNASFVISSAQNIDRFVSVFKACRNTRKQVVVDVYNAWVLDVVKQKSPNLPRIG
jgi:ribonuclease J